MGQIARVFINVSMANGHKGLAEIAKAHKIRIEKLEPGQFVLFINRARTKLKALASNDVLSYVNKDERLTLEAIQYIPAAFGLKGRFSYDEALRMAIEESMAKGQRKSLEIY